MIIKKAALLKIPQTLEDALTALQSGGISATQLVEFALSRVSEKDAQLHGFITLTKEEALLKAEKIDQARQSGQELGVLIKMFFLPKVLERQQVQMC